MYSVVESMHYSLNDKQSRMPLLYFFFRHNKSEAKHNSCTFNGAQRLRVQRCVAGYACSVAISMTKIVPAGCSMMRSPLPTQDMFKQAYRSNVDIALATYLMSVEHE